MLDVQVTSARLQSNGQASVHILNAGAYVHVVNSVLGSTDGAQTYDCLNVEPAAIPNLQITTNDCTGVAHLPIVYASPYPSPSPSFVPLLRNNRGAQGTVFTGSASISTASLTLSNQGPFDCTYYLDYNGAGTTTVTITYPDGVSQALPAGLVPISLFLPVGAGFSMAAVSGGSVSWTVFCLP